MKFQGQAAKNPPFGVHSQKLVVGVQQKMEDFWHSAECSSVRPNFLVLSSLQCSKKWEILLWLRLIIKISLTLLSFFQLLLFHQQKPISKYFAPQYFLKMVPMVPSLTFHQHMPFFEILRTAISKKKQSMPKYNLNRSFVSNEIDNKHMFIKRIGHRICFERVKCKHQSRIFSRLVT